MNGDIECAQDVRDMQGVVDEAAGALSPLLVIEMGGNNVRLDLVRDAGSLIRRSKVPVAVYLNDPGDRTVGPGQLCLGLVAASCAIAPGTVVRGMTGSPGLASLAPEKIDWSSVTSEVQEWIGKGSMAEGLRAAILSPTRPAWAVFGADGVSVVMEKPAAGIDALPIVTEVGGEVQLGLDSKAAARLKLVEELPHWTSVIARFGVRTSARTDRSLTVGLAGPGQRVRPLLDRIDSDEDQLKTTLKLPWPVPKKISPGTYRDAAARARPRIDDAEAAIRELEKLLADYPELMRRPAPDQTGVGGKPSTYASRWRSLVQGRKDRVARHAATAEKFARAGE